MIRKVFSTLCAALAITGAVKAQESCGTTEQYNSMKASFPQIQMYEEQLNAFIAEGMKNFHSDRAKGKGTAAEDPILHIPVVVHVVHDYDKWGPDYVTVNFIIT